MNQDFEETRDFAEIVTDFRGGICHQELSEALQQATDATMRTGKMSTVTLAIKIKMAGERQVEITDEVKTKIPKPTQPTSIMFVDDNRNLNRCDTRQMNLGELATAEKPKAELVSIDKKTGELKEVNAK